ncbi:fumarylacetoacetate hydrolase family protein [Streptomyces sp. NPDC005953]|uniref:fumarylacetoacetate hydrolase family protein n=1 Tax=Streptomyces sp. NPDC005953 TaxID=3156719 RepID=UPI0033D0D0FA
MVAQQRYARFEQQGQIRHGLVVPGEESQALQVLDGDPIRTEAQPTGEVVGLDEGRLLAPVAPGKIVAVGRNYADHVAEMGMGAPSIPRLFFKPPSAVVGPGALVFYPPQSQQVEHEAELAVVIGRTARHVPAAGALDYVFGYTCGNDVTARDIQKADGQPSWAKGFDTFCPLGPWIVPGLDPTKLDIRCTVNSVERQQSNTQMLLTPVAKLIEYITAAVTLEPGDVILTGTPAGVGPVEVGDWMAVSIEGIGTLRNRVSSAAE